MLPDTQIQEEISRAFIYSIASKAGFTFDRPSTDYDSIDVRISAIGKADESSIIESPTLEVQVKATYAHTFDKDEMLHFPLKIKNYNDLRRNSASPRLLVVFLMPREKDNWVKSDHDKTEIKHCGYWLSLKGMQEIQGQETKTVLISKKDIFNEDSLKQMMIKISRGEELNNAI